MNNRSAKGRHLSTFAEIQIHGNEGDWYFSEGENPDHLFIYIPGSGVVAWPLKPEKAVNGHWWRWDGNRDAPTLTPSLHLIGQWHGWMRNGELVSV